MHVHVEQQYDQAALYQAAGVPAEMEQQYEQVVTCSLLTTTKTGIELTLPSSNFTNLEKAALLAGTPSGDLKYRLEQMMIGLEVPATVKSTNEKSTTERTIIYLHLFDQAHFSGARFQWGQLVLQSNLSDWVRPGERAVLKEMISFSCPKFRNARGSQIEIDAGILGSSANPAAIAKRETLDSLSSKMTAAIGGNSAQRNAPLRGSESLGNRSKILYRSS